MSTEKQETADVQDKPVASGVVGSQANHNLQFIAGLLALTTMGLLAATIALAVVNVNDNDDKYQSPSLTFPTIRPPAGENICAGQNPELPNVQCVIDGIDMTNEQAGSNVTKGYQGLRNVTVEPILLPFWQVGMCPVNVHWHVGAEHLSVGEYDETGTGPSPEVHERLRRLAGNDAPQGERQGFQCKLYDENDAKFTAPYKWQHCLDMQVGQTYEVHWPHSAAGACGTPNQYQTPFQDGVFCLDNVITATHEQIGVQAQVFVVVNDESYYYPDLMRGMIVDGAMGADVAKYTGSTTGTSVNNEICSQYAPITWQVDRKCHLISASTFDKMCADMKAQRDDMSVDLHPHGSRELVANELAANNHQDRRRRGAFLRTL